MTKRFGQGRLEKNTVFSLSTKIVEAGFYFITDIIIANILDKNLYGEWCFFYSIVTMLFLVMGFGINSSIRVKVAREWESRERQNSCISIGIEFRSVIGIGLTIILLLMSNYLAIKLGYPDKYPELKLLIIIGTFLCLSNSFSEYYKSIYIGMEKFNYVFYLALVEYGGYFIFGLSFLYISESIYGLEIGYILALLMVVLCGRKFYIKEFTRAGCGRATVDFEKNIRKEILRDAVPFLVTACGTLVFAEIDTFMLGALSTPEEVGVYSIAKNLVSKATHVNFAICTATMPSFASMNVKNIVDKQKLFKGILKINISVAVIIMAVLFSGGPLAISLLYGKQYFEAGQILRWLLLYFFLYIIHLIFSMIMDYQGYIKFRSFIFLTAIVLNMMLNYFWIPRNGAKGAAFATSISMLPYDIFMVISVIKIFKKYKREWKKQ